MFPLRICDIIRQRQCGQLVTTSFPETGMLFPLLFPCDSFWSVQPTTMPILIPGPGLQAFLLEHSRQTHLDEDSKHPILPLVMRTVDPTGVQPHPSSTLSESIMALLGTEGSCIFPYSNGRNERGPGKACDSHIEGESWQGELMLLYPTGKDAHSGTAFPLCPVFVTSPLTVLRPPAKVALRFKLQALESARFEPEFKLLPLEALQIQFSVL